jgi:hypothetical protein
MELILRKYWSSFKHIRTKLDFFLNVIKSEINLIKNFLDFLIWFTICVIRFISTFLYFNSKRLSFFIICITILNPILIHNLIWNLWTKPWFIYLLFIIVNFEIDSFEIRKLALFEFSLDVIVFSTYSFSSA